MAISADVLDAPGRPVTPAELIREMVPDQPVLLVGPAATWDAFGVTAWLEARGGGAARQPVGGVTAPHRVVHFGTGFAGVHALRAIIQRPDLELVGLVVHSDDKAGRTPANSPASTGRACSRPKTSTRRSRSTPTLLLHGHEHGRLKVTVGELCQILESGMNVVTTSFGLLIHPATARPDVLARLRSPDASAARRCSRPASIPGSSATTCLSS